MDEGVVRSIGVSNFQAQSLYDILSYARHPISSLQIEHHPYLVQPGLVQMAQLHSIIVTAYSSFGPQSFLELPEVFSAKAKNIPTLFEAEPIPTLAKKYGVTHAQILLRWATQRQIPNKKDIQKGVFLANILIGISRLSQNPTIQLD